jgi:lambda family phage portal protein
MRFLPKLFGRREAELSRIREIGEVADGFRRSVPGVGEMAAVFIRHGAAPTEFRSFCARVRAGRGFNAAAINRLTGDWPTTLQGMDSVLRMELKPLRARARDLTKNNPYFSGYLRFLKTNVIGSEGMTLKVKATWPAKVENGKLVRKPDLLANTLIQDAWWEWCKKENCTVHKNLTWLDVQNLMVETLAVEGQFLAIKKRGTHAKNKFGFALQLVDNDSLDLDYNEDLGDGRQIRMGIEKDGDGAVLAYHFFKYNPSDTLYATSTRRERVRVMAKDVVHLFMTRSIGQTQGYPWAAAVMLMLQMLGAYDEAELVASRNAANKHGFFKRTGEGKGYEGASDGAGNKIMESEPGSWTEIDQGLEPVVVDWKHPSGAYAAFVGAMLRGMGTGLGQSYPTLANDYASVNFSSGRMSQMEEREFLKCLQRLVADHGCAPIYEDWVDVSLLRGAIPLPYEKVDKFLYHCWFGRRWSWVDPEKEVQAKIKEINAGFTSYTRVLSEMGIDVDEHLDEIEQDQKRLKDRGIKLSEIYSDEKESDLEFQQKAWLGFQADGTVGDVLANQTDIKKLTKDVGLPVQADYTEPWLPVKDDTGAPVTGEVLKDSEGDIVGGQAGPAPTAPGGSKDEKPEPKTAA